MNAGMIMLIATVVGTLLAAVAIILQLYQGGSLSGLSALINPPAAANVATSATVSAGPTPSPTAATGAVDASQGMPSQVAAANSLGAAYDAAVLAGASNGVATQAIADRVAVPLAVDSGAVLAGPYDDSSPYSPSPAPTPRPTTAIVSAMSRYLVGNSGP